MSALHEVIIYVCIKYICQQVKITWGKISNVFIIYQKNEEILTFSKGC